MTQEIWREIPGYEGLYWVSSLGKIKSNKGILKPVPVKGGYLRIKFGKNGRRFLVHRLVAWAFPEICGEYFPGATVNHKDENPANNCAWNLEWCTQSYNNSYGSHRKNLSISCSGKGCKPVFQYSVSGDLIKEWDSIKSTGYQHSHISQCCNGHRKTAYGFIWSHQPLISNPSTGSASTRSSINASRNLSS